MKKKHKTTVGRIDADVLSYTAGRDIELDHYLIESDCIGAAAHVVMLSRLPVKPPLFGAKDVSRIIAELVNIIRSARRGQFRITLEDQDVHLAIERTLTGKLGDLGKRIHTARSRNDQVAVDLRLMAKVDLLNILEAAAHLAERLLAMARTHEKVPMVGRTHMQTAMPSSVGLWASAHAESLLDDCALLISAYDLNDQCPLGSAAGYGVPAPIDRQRVSDLLGFARPCHNVLYAGNARGKIESIILSALSQVMLTVSRMAQDLMLFTMPEFRYFTLPPEFCTGSSIMPQKRNPDVLELVRAKATRVMTDALCVYDIVKSSPSGYNRDLQETKEPFLNGLQLTGATLRVLARLVEGLKVNQQALLDGFTPDVFATDRALELVFDGMPFRDAYHHVKEHLDELKQIDPHEAVARKKHLGAPMGLDFTFYDDRIHAVQQLVAEDRSAFHKAVSKLLDVSYPELA